MGGDVMGTVRGTASPTLGMTCGIHGGQPDWALEADRPMRRSHFQSTSCSDMTRSEYASGSD